MNVPRAAPGAWRWIALVALVAVVTNFGLAFKRGISRPMQSDAFYFLEIAKSVAAGEGYSFSRQTYWPDQPTMRRLPAWPIVVAAGLELTGSAAPEAVMRITGLTANVLAACMLAVLTLRLFGSRLGAAAAGLAYAVHPYAIHFGDLGLSEPLFVLLVAGGVVCLLRGLDDSKPVLWLGLGALLHGLACLVRANFVVWIAFATIAAACYLIGRRPVRLRVRVPVLLLCACLFALPPLFWMGRNYRLTGEFPVLSTLRGQTFYGGNNPVVADTLEFWGYWVFPGDLEGEESMEELARTMSEREVDAYYYERGKEYVRDNWESMPRLLLGKLTRAYVPVPWTPGLYSYVASLYRWGLYALAVMGIMLAWRRTRPAYKICLLAMTATNLSMVLVFWGYPRFAFALEPFFLPFLGVAVTTVAQRWRQSNPT